MFKSYEIELNEQEERIISKIYMSFYDWCINHYDDAPTKEEFIKNLIIIGAESYE